MQLLYISLCSYCTFLCAVTVHFFVQLLYISLYSESMRWAGREIVKENKVCTERENLGEENSRLLYWPKIFATVPTVSKMLRKSTAHNTK